MFAGTEQNNVLLDNNKIIEVCSNVSFDMAIQARSILHKSVFSVEESSQS